MPIDLKDWLPLDYVPQQAALWNSPARFVCVVAPRQSGKSLLCFRKIILEALQRQGRYIYVLPTINQARKVCWARMCEMLKPLSAEVVAMNKSELAFYFRNGSILTLESGEKRERIEGVSITGAIIDESSDQLPGLYELSVLPALMRIEGSWVWRVGVPKANGVGGQDFKETCEKYQVLSETDSDYAHFHWTYGSKESRKVLKMSLDEKGYREQALGKWATYSGGCYYAFADDNIMTECFAMGMLMSTKVLVDERLDTYEKSLHLKSSDTFRKITRGKIEKNLNYSGIINRHLDIRGMGSGTITEWHERRSGVLFRNQST